MAWLGHRKVQEALRTVAIFEKMVARLTSDALVLDLGANRGDVTALLAVTGAQVHAFEPEPCLYGKLEERFRDRPNVTLHQAAIGGRPGRMKLHIDTKFETDPLTCRSHSLIAGSPSTSGGRTVDVACLDFFAFVESLGRTPDIVKMDIEGAEVDILDRMVAEDRFDAVGSMFVETHERQFAQLSGRIVAIHRHLSGKPRPDLHLFWP